MNMSGKGAFASDSKLTTLKSTSLNPHATEFVPFSLQSSSRIVSSADASSKNPTSANVTLGKAVLDRSESSVSNNSDDEVHQYWRQQLPDDITPDFNVVGEDESLLLNNLSLSGLSISNANETSRFPASAGSDLMFKVRQEFSPRPVGGNRLTERVTYPLSYGEDPSADYIQNISTNSWDEQFMNNNQLMANVRGGAHLNGNVGHGFSPNMLNEQLDYTDVDSLEFLSSQFPGFSAESLGEVYFANGGDLNLTIEMLTQLELQIDGSLNQNGSSKTVSSPNLTALDFPALSAAEGQNGMPMFTDDEVSHGNSYRPSDKDNMLMFRSRSSIPSLGQIDFASAVKKMASQDSGIWKYDRNGSSDASVGSSRSSHVLASSYSSGQGREVFGDRLQPRASSRAPPVWLETGEAVANMYSEVREEARDHARLRNAYFEQARQAYLIGNKALAKELSGKGQLHNMEMKAAHGKAQESIYRQRNPGGSGMQVKESGHERIIDLHGLHVNEAIHVLKRELSVLRNAAQSVGQRLQVYICVGTGHHTRGSRTPARLPVAVQRYLLEDEGLDYSEPQPGLLRVVVY